MPAMHHPASTRRIVMPQSIVFTGLIFGTDGPGDYPNTAGNDTTIQFSWTGTLSVGDPVDVTVNGTDEGSTFYTYEGYYDDNGTHDIAYHNGGLEYLAGEPAAGTYAITA